MEPSKLNKATSTGGVKAMPIEGPMREEGYRLKGLTDLERAWRRQWLKDQILAPNEPMPVPGYYEARYNPIRRFYRWPLDKLFMKLVPRLGYEKASYYRMLTGGITLCYLVACCVTYNLKYCHNDWTRHGGIRIHKNRPEIFPGDDRYPFVGEKINHNDYFDEGFKQSPI